MTEYDLEPLTLEEAKEFIQNPNARITLVTDK